MVFQEPNRGVNPDEAIAYGAAILAGILGGHDEPNKLLVLESNPFSLGIATEGGAMTKLIPRNTYIPTKKSQIFSTAPDIQPFVTIHVLEGEHPMFKDNNMLGHFDLTGIPPAKRGVPQIEVTFELDANSILKVSAKNKGTGQKNDIVIQNDNNRLSKEDIERMINDAEKFSEEDEAVKEKVEAKNDLEGLTYNLKNQIDDKEKLGGKLSDEEKSTIENAVDEKIKWLDSNPDASVEEMKSQKKSLEEVVNPIISKIYQNNGSASPPETEDDGSERTEL